MSGVRCFHCGRVRGLLFMQRTALNRYVCADTNACTKHFEQLRKAQAEATTRGLVPDRWEAGKTPHVTNDDWRSLRDIEIEVTRIAESVESISVDDHSSHSHSHSDYSAPDTSSTSDSFSGGGGDFGGGGASGEW